MYVPTKSAELPSCTSHAPGPTPTQASGSSMATALLVPPVWSTHHCLGAGHAAPIDSTASATHERSPSPVSFAVSTGGGTSSSRTLHPEVAAIAAAAMGISRESCMRWMLQARTSAASPRAKIMEPTGAPVSSGRPSLETPDRHELVTQLELLRHPETRHPATALAELAGTVVSHFTVDRGARALCPSLRSR